MQTHSKILLVEDNLADVELTKIAFRNQNISTEIIHCEDGKVALDFLTKNSTDGFDYLLLDLNMPRLNGLDLLKICKQDPLMRKLPVIVFTTSANQDDIQKCYEFGANAYVLKPVDLSDFDRTIQAINSFWGEVNVRANFV
ncbi:MAG: CheY-like chemotaxis protein [Saprospiraceae bacterium]|jgi:CheY-like chemotaxis protein